MLKLSVAGGASGSASGHWPMGACVCRGIRKSDDVRCRRLVAIVETKSTLQEQ